MTNPFEDVWGWAEPDAGISEPGLYAYRTRPTIASGAPVRIVISTFITSGGSIAAGFAPGSSVAFPIAGYPGGPRNSDGTGGWSRNKTYFTWIYDSVSASASQQNYIAIADTSHRPIPVPNPGDFFTADLTYFDITGQGLYDPTMARSVPSGSNQISFLALSASGSSSPRNLYLIGATNPAIESVITASSLHSGANQIVYYAWSPDGRYLFARVDNRFIIRDRQTNSNVLNVVASFNPGPPQFSEDASLLYYSSGGQLLIRRESDGWTVGETVTEEGTYNCNGPQPFGWHYPRLSPDGRYWLNIFRATCGAPLQYRSFMRLRNHDFGDLVSNDVTAFASGHFLGDFTNDSRWFIGGDGNINGNSRVRMGPSPNWHLFDQTNTQTATHFTKSFQAW